MLLLYLPAIGPVGSLVRVLVFWAYRRRALVAVAGLCALAAAAEGARRLSFDTDVLSLLPRDGRAIPAFRRFLATFGSLDQLYVVFTAPDGHAIADYADDIDRWTDALRRAPEIRSVDAGVIDAARDFGWLADRQLLLLPGDALEEALARLGAGGVRAAVASRRELLTLPSAEITEIIRQDPVGLFDLMRDALGGTGAGASIGLGGDGYVTDNGRSRLIIAEPVRPPYDTAFSRALDARLRAIEGAVTAGTSIAADDLDRRPPMDVQFAGGHSIALETEAFVKRESVFNTIGSLALILPILFIAFRSAWLVVVGSLPSALSLLVVLGALGLSGATLSSAATGSAAMVFGLGIDGVVLLYVAYRLALARGASPEGAIEATAGPSASMLLGMWTTAATFYGLMFVDFPALQELGRLIGHSMVVCGVLTLFMVPATLPRAPARSARSLVAPRLAAWIERRRRPILVGAFAITVALGLAATGIRINPTLDRLQSVTPAAALQARIAAMFGLPEDMYVVLAEGDDLAALLEADEQLAARLAERLPELAMQPGSALLPSPAAQSRAADRIRRAQLSPDTVRASVEQAAIAEGFRRGAFEPFLERLPELLESDRRVTYDGYAAHGLGDLLGRFVRPDGSGWMLATYLFPSSEEQAATVQDIIDGLPSHQTLTGLPLVNRELSERFVPEFLKGLVGGTVVVVALIVAAFRQWWLSVLAMLPTAMGLVWTAGLLGLAGAELDLFALFAVVTFVGIGVDYGIHLVHRYRERGDARRAVSELAPVIVVAAAITLLGYGTLMNSSYPPLRSIGVVSAVSVLALTATSVLVLPALLMSRRS